MPRAILAGPAALCHGAGRRGGGRRVKDAIRAVQEALERHDYIAEPAIATAVYLARELRKPLLVEGDAGVGKTEIGKVLARMLDTELIRLQCYQGLDVNTALYEWNYQRQILHLRIVERDGRDPAEVEAAIFGRDYLLERPLLRAITRREGPPVLLVDEVDRADDGFEAFLLELLSDFQVTIPELGPIRAAHIPYVVLTSNRSREIGDALRRRCLYLYIEHPSLEKEVHIIKRRVPGVSQRLADQVARFVQALRARRLSKVPGVAETLDWGQALVRLHRDHLDLEAVQATLGCLLKDRDDLSALAATETAALVAAAQGTETAAL
ncbi:MAG: MoxR family ATPase [Gemmatimonadetes bacterium]|nr:MoxR family ATPase [Gemmatimonadota bacterium]